MDVETPLAKRLRRMPSDPLLDVSSGEELSLFTTTQNSSDSSQVCTSYSILLIITVSLAEIFFNFEKFQVSKFSILSKDIWPCF